MPVGLPITVFERGWVLSWLVRAGRPGRGAGGDGRPTCGPRSARRARPPAPACPPTPTPPRGALRAGAARRCRASPRRCWRSTPGDALLHLAGRGRRLGQRERARAGRLRRSTCAARPAGGGRVRTGDGAGGGLAGRAAAGRRELEGPMARLALLRDAELRAGARRVRRPAVRRRGAAGPGSGCWPPSGPTARGAAGRAGRRRPRTPCRSLLLCRPGLGRAVPWRPRGADTSISRECAPYQIMRRYGMTRTFTARRQSCAPPSSRLCTWRESRIQDELYWETIGHSRLIMASIRVEGVTLHC